MSAAIKAAVIKGSVRAYALKDFRERGVPMPVYRRPRDGEQEIAGMVPVEVVEMPERRTPTPKGDRNG